MKTSTQDKSSILVAENIQVAVELDKTGATAVGIISLFLGGWAIASMTAGVIASGSPAGLVTAFVKTLVG